MRLSGYLHSLYTGHNKDNTLKFLSFRVFFKGFQDENLLNNSTIGQQLDTMKI